MSHMTGEVRNAKIDAAIKTFRNPDKVDEFLAFLEDFEGLTWDFEGRPSFYVVYLNAPEDEIGCMVDVGLGIGFPGGE